MLSCVSSKYELKKTIWCTDDQNLEGLFSFALFLFANTTDHLISINSDFPLYCMRQILSTVYSFRCVKVSKVRPVNTTANSNSLHIYVTEKVEGD